MLSYTILYYTIEIGQHTYHTNGFGSQDLILAGTSLESEGARVESKIRIGSKTWNHPQVSINFGGENFGTVTWDLVTLSIVSLNKMKHPRNTFFKRWKGERWRLIDSIGDFFRVMSCHVESCFHWGLLSQKHIGFWVKFPSSRRHHVQDHMMGWVWFKHVEDVGWESLES